MELAVLNTLGQETGRKVVLSDAVFGVEANDHAIYLDVKQFLADQRQGTHKSKQRNEVAGSTRKLKRQKGTGGARCGSIKSPLFPVVAVYLVPYLATTASSSTRSLSSWLAVAHLPTRHRLTQFAFWRTPQWRLLRLRPLLLFRRR